MSVVVSPAIFAPARVTARDPESSALFERLLTELARLIFSRHERPTSDELDLLFMIPQTEPLAEIEALYQLHKKNNTSMYKEVVEESRRLLSTPPR